MLILKPAIPDKLYFTGIALLSSKCEVQSSGCPIKSKALSGVDSLYSIVQMPKGVAVGTLAIGEAGAANAGLLAAQVIALHDDNVREKIIQFRENQTQAVLENATLERS